MLIVEMCELQPRRERERLGIELRAADHAWLRVVLARQLERALQTVDHFAARNV